MKKISLTEKRAAAQVNGQMNTAAPVANPSTAPRPATNMPIKGANGPVPTTTPKRPIKEEQSKKKGSIVGKLIVIIGVLLLLAVLGYGAYKFRSITANNDSNSSGAQGADACTNILDPNCWTQAFKPELLKEDGKTNALVLGIDSRASGGGSGLMNTDTIILLTLDHATGNVRMLSFPRDLYAPYGCDDKMPYKTKINAIYAYGKFNCSDKDGMRAIKATIEKISGEKIQYTGIVKLDGVVQAIDAMGGIAVDIPKDHTDVYPYVELPAEQQKTCKATSKGLPGKYCIFEFKKGVTNMDGQTALIYSRMRYWSSDFDRARRQQEVVDAMKNKIVGDETPTAEKAANLLKLYQGLQGNIEFALDLPTILAGLAELQSVNANPLKVVMDPTFGGGGLITNGTGSNYNFRDYSFKEVHTVLDFITSNADLFRDKAKIYAVNYTGAAWPTDNPITPLTKKEYKWFMEVVSDTKPKVAEKFGVEIIDYSGGKKTSTTEWLKVKFAEKYGEENVKVIIADEANALKPSTQYKEDVGVAVYPVAATPAASATPKAN